MAPPQDSTPPSPTAAATPYRAAPPADTVQRRVVVVRRRWAWLGVVATAVTGVWWLGHHRPARTDLPPEFRDHLTRFPFPGADLRPSTPLAPLLAADQPDGLALLQPSGDAVRVERGNPIVLRFNRPMVPTNLVGRDLADSPLEMHPRLAGTVRWTARSALQFTPESSVWDTPREVRVTLSQEIHSLAGETFGTLPAFTAVIAGGARLDPDASPHRVLPGQPIPLAFEGPISPAALRGQVMAYEVGGGGRTLTFTPSARGRDDHGRSLIDLHLGTTLEAGAQVALAFAPSLYTTWEGSTDPAVIQFQLAPWPQIEGIDCPEHATSAEACSYQDPPGRVVDIQDTLRLFATNPLAAVTPASVTVRPEVAALRTVLDGNTLAISAEWAAGQVYELRLANLNDTSGTALRQAGPLAVRSAGRPPQVVLPRGRLTYERGPFASLPFAAVHADSASLEYAAVAPGTELATALGAFSPRPLPGFNPTWQVMPLHPMVPDERANHWARGRFGWLEPASGRGASMALIGFRLPGQTAETPEERPATRTFVQSTDLGITAQVLPRGVMTWVTSLSHAAPVANAEVTVATGTTVSAVAHSDVSGVAWIPLATSSVEHAVAVRAVSGDDRAVLVIDPRTAVRPATLGLAPGGDAAVTNAPVAGVMTDRGAYRPGESMHVRVVVRSVAGEQLAAVTHGAVRIALEGPAGAGDPIVRVGRLSRFGTADADLVLPATASLGSYSVTVRRPGDVQPIGSASVTVAEFRQPSVRVDLQVDASEPAEGDTITAHAVGAYLFGAPTAGCQAHWSLTRQPGAAMPQRWSDYTFLSADASPRAGTVDTGDITLDARGRADVPVRVALGASARENLTFEVSVRDPSGQSTAAQRTLTAYPARWELGVRTGPAWVERNAPLDVDTVVITHAGEPVAGRTVTARILREAWHAYWAWSDHAHDDDAGPAGGYLPRRNHDQEVAHTCTVVSSTEPVHCAWTPDRPGTYVLEARTTDDAGRTAVASRRVYVAAPDERPDRDPPGAPIAVTPARREWTVGETARVAFESPWPDAEALITVEREGVLHTERRRVLAGGVTVDLPVTPDMVPNAYVSVVLARPRTAAPGRELDLGAPDLRWGAAELSVRAHATPLDVALSVAATTLQPGTDLPVEVTVHGSDGRGVVAEVALFAVDEGTLRLTGYTPPDPLAGLVPRRAPSFAWEDLRRTLMSHTDVANLPGASGDGTEDGSQGLRDVRERFDPTPLWHPHLVTDAQGRAHVTFHLPDRPTQYRVMAVAVDAGVRSGRASTVVTATRPVVLRAVLPAAVTAGDRFEAAVFVHNTADTPVDAEVVATVNGHRGDIHHVHLAGQSDARVGEWITALGDAVEVRFDATAGAQGDTATVRVTVAPRGHTRHALALGTAQGERDVTLALPPDALVDHGTVGLVVAPHPFLGIEPAMAALADLPVEGAEPLASTLLAWASVASLNPGARTGLWSASELQHHGESAIAALLSLQMEGGGFGYWEGADQPDPVVTATVLHALVTARRVGWAVPSGPMDRLVAAVDASLRDGAYAGDGVDGYENLAFALRVLAECNHADSARVTTLFEQRDRLSTYGQAQLAMAMPATDHRRDPLVLNAAQRALSPSLRGPFHAFRWLDTTVCTTSAVLEAIAVTGVAWPSVGQVAIQVLTSRENGDWGTLRDNAAAMQALSAFSARFHGTAALDASVTLDGQPLTPTATSTAGARYTLAFSRLARGSHRLHIHSRDAVFFSLSARWVDPLGPADDTARGLGTTLHRVYETESGVTLGPDAHVHLGDLVRVRLFTYDEGPVTPYVTLRDPIPGGFESVDHDLATTPRASLDALLGGGPDDTSIDPRAYHALRSLDLVTARHFDRGVTVFHIDHGTPGLHEFTYGIRASAVGTFVALPAESAAMYTSDYVARSVATTLHVDP